jgi:hypothetical protein
MAERLTSCIVTVGCLERVDYYSLAFGFETGQRGGFIQEFVLPLVFSEP